MKRISILLLAAAAAGCAARFRPPVDIPLTVEGKQLHGTLHALPGWRASRDLTAAEWDRYLEAASAFQRAGTSDIEAAFDHFFWDIYGPDTDEAWNGDYLPASKAFVLLRVMFECPERVRSPQVRMGGMWWGCASEDGTESIAWPLAWDAATNRPVQVARYQGRDGPPYHPTAEYRAFLQWYPMREIPK